MKAMFCMSNFNGDISHWKVSNVFSFEDMFHKSPFQGDLSDWDLRDACFNSCFLSDINLSFDKCPVRCLTCLKKISQKDFELCDYKNNKYTYEYCYPDTFSVSNNLELELYEDDCYLDEESEVEI